MPPARRLRPDLATIRPGVPFLDTLAAAWLAEAGDDPLAVADGLILLPTRRACRGLAEAFLRASGGRALLLPRIAPFGALDAAPLDAAGGLAIAPAVSGPERLAVLTRFILAMDGIHGAPRTAERAWPLAQELAALLDEAALSEIDLTRRLPDAAGAEWAAHWGVTLQFLAIVTAAWPNWLAEAGLSDMAARQVRLLDAASAAWEADPPSCRVIAAGSTGAIPAVARLLRVVAHLPRGSVVLPGLDRELDEASFAALDDTHPQAGLRALLGALDARRGDVRDVGPASAWPEREATLRLALLPAASLGQWRDGAGPGTGAVSRLEAPDQEAEAVAIALALRAELEIPGHVAALVTPDRGLAERVTAALLRFGVIADDSAGEALAATPPAAFLRLIAVALAEDFAPVPLLAMLKHPLAAAGLSRAGGREAARALELACLRGPRPAPGFAALRARHGDAAFLDRLEDALGDLVQLGEFAGGDAWLEALVRAAETLATTDTEPGAETLWAGEEGAALAVALAELRPALRLLTDIDRKGLPELLVACLAGLVVRGRRALRGRDGAEHPRVFIWGLLEARLQSADLIVLGGLVEGVWPPAATPGPWLNRAMRAAIGLPSPEAAVGGAAHDFVMTACAAERVILSAPSRRDHAPAVPSRWLVRLEALLAGQGMHLPAHPAADWARALDLPAGPPLPVLPPTPRPPVALRPRRLSVTEIGTWLTDPYAIHARHVLKLRVLDPIDPSIDAADYGRVVHGGLERFLRRFGHAWPAEAAAELAADFAVALAEAGMRPALAAWWRPRLARIAAWIAELETARRSDAPIQAIVAEAKGAWQFEAPAGAFTLTGRADRIERHFDGAYAVIDYKTGTVPGEAHIKAGLAPQLPLEAAMLVQGAFPDTPAGETAELAYWHITGGREPGSVRKLLKGEKAAIAESARGAAKGLRELVARFDDPATAYLSQPRAGAPPRFGDYAKLARTAEWGGEAEEAEPEPGA